MCSAPSVSKTSQFFYQKANQLGKEAVYDAPKATATLLAVAPLALHLFQPEGMLTQMLTLAATTGAVLYAPRMYNYVSNHPLTAQVCTKVCAQPFVQQICQHPRVQQGAALVQQGTAAVSSAIDNVPDFCSKLRHRLLPKPITDVTYDQDDHQKQAEIKFSGEEKKKPLTESEGAAPKRSSLAMQLDTLKRAFKAVPTAAGATLAVSAIALRLFQPGGIITQFATLTTASGSFFTGAKLYGKYHNHPVVKKVSDHPVVATGTALASQAYNKVTNLVSQAVQGVSTFMQATKAAYGRAFYPEAAAAPVSRESVPVTPAIVPYQEFRKFLRTNGAEETWEGFTIPEKNMEELYAELPKLFGQGDLPPTTAKVRVVTRRGSAQKASDALPDEQSPSAVNPELSLPSHKSGSTTARISAATQYPDSSQYSAFPAFRHSVADQSWSYHYEGNEPSGGTQNDSSQNPLPPDNAAPQTAQSKHRKRTQVQPDASWRRMEGQTQ